MSYMDITTTDHKTRLFTGKPTCWGSAPVKIMDLSIPIPQKRLTHDQWTHIQQKLKPEADTLAILVKNLVATSLFSNLSIITRHQAVSQLEKTFLDPEEKLQRVATLPS
jgi:hypothetical protein